MRRTMWIARLVVAVASLGARSAHAEGERDVEALRQAVDALTEEVRHLKEHLAVPATDDELASVAGLGPGASRIYTRASGLSVGGYGEFLLEEPTGPGRRTADFVRLVTYVGYKFAPDLLVNSEVEVEHSSTEANLSGGEGSVSVEFAYLDILASPAVGIRLGQLLAPLGLINEMHEPPFFHGNARPLTERMIIPSTWRGLGAGMHGDLGEELSYRLYLIESLDAIGFSESGLRGGRQKGNRSTFEDAAVTGRLEWNRGGLTLGGSGFFGKTGQEREIDGREIDAMVTVASAHAVFRHRAVEGKALFAATSIGDAEEVGRLLADGGDAVAIPERQVGGYAELALEVGRHLGLTPQRRLDLFVRAEAADLQREVPTGFTADPTLDRRSLTLGAEYRPHPSVVLKADWTAEDDAADSDLADPLRIGAGFVF